MNDLLTLFGFFFLHIAPPPVAHGRHAKGATSSSASAMSTCHPAAPAQSLTVTSSTSTHRETDAARLSSHVNPTSARSATASARPNVNSASHTHRPCPSSSFKRRSPYILSEAEEEVEYIARGGVVDEDDDIPGLMEVLDDEDEEDDEDDDERRERSERERMRRRGKRRQ